MDQVRASCPCCHMCPTGGYTHDGEPYYAVRFGPVNACPDKENHQ